MYVILTTRCGLQPSEIDDLPLEKVEEYLLSIDPGDTITLPDKAALQRYMASRR